MLRSSQTAARVLRFLSTLYRTGVCVCARARACVGTSSRSSVYRGKPLQAAFAQSAGLICSYGSSDFAPPPACETKMSCKLEVSGPARQPTSPPAPLPERRIAMPASLTRLITGNSGVGHNLITGWAKAKPDTASSPLARGTNWGWVRTPTPPRGPSG